MVYIFTWAYSEISAQYYKSLVDRHFHRNQTGKMKKMTELHTVNFVRQRMRKHSQREAILKQKLFQLMKNPNQSAINKNPLRR